MGTLENKFSWSNTRAATFEWCRRMYWWQYYGSWGGWESRAKRETREAYLLKNLTARWAWVGTAVHEAIEATLKRMRTEAAGHPLPFSEGLDVDQEVEALTDRMREQYRESNRDVHRERPKRRFRLMEHEYSDPVSREEWQATSDKARRALKNFFEGDVFKRIEASDPAEWLEIEHLGQFDLDGVGVWASPDFARRLDEGRAEIYDWKTGEVEPDKCRRQMACYALYLEKPHGIVPTKVETYLVYLGDDAKVHPETFTREDLDGVLDEIRKSVKGMKALLSDEEKNVAEREAFPMTDDRTRCASCVYRRLCGR